MPEEEGPSDAPTRVSNRQCECPGPTHGLAGHMGVCGLAISIRAGVVECRGGHGFICPECAMPVQTPTGLEFKCHAD